jgi:hypothetical protein
MITALYAITFANQQIACCVVRTTDLDARSRNGVFLQARYAPHQAQRR